jgi:glycosyltransferase involved in cell wall biosynthesis
VKIALYYPWVYLTSGAERTILELTGRSRHEWTIFTNRFEPSRTFTGFRNREVRQLKPVSVKRNMFAAAAGAWRILTQRLPLEGYSALVVVCEGFGDLVLFRNGSTPAINLCLTPLRLSFDDAYRDVCLSRRGLLDRILIGMGAKLFRSVDRLAWGRYRRIICISHEAKRRAVAGGLAHPEQMQVAHVGLGFEPRTPSDRFEPFFLIAGRIMWTKNIEVGIEAFLKFRRESSRFADFRLVIAGMVDRKSESYFARLREQAGGPENGIEFRTSVSDDELADLYRRCYATLFTAFNEDWGIVPLESMSFGKPVIATDSGGPREYMVDEQNGFLVAGTAAAFAERMRELADDLVLCRAMGRRGVETARSFSWEKFASVIDSTVEELAYPLLSTAERPQTKQHHDVSSAV